MGSLEKKPLEHHIDKLGILSGGWKIIGAAILVVGGLVGGFIPLETWSKIGIEPVYLGLLSIFGLVMVHSGRPHPLDDPSVFGSVEQIQKLEKNIVGTRAAIHYLGFIVLLVLMGIIVLSNGLKGEVLQASTPVQTPMEAFVSTDSADPLRRPAPTQTPMEEFVSRYSFGEWNFLLTALGVCVSLVFCLIIKICFVNIQVVRMQSQALQIKYREDKNRIL